jgi:hypothetical protein
MYSLKVVFPLESTVMWVCAEHCSGGLSVIFIQLIKETSNFPEPDLYLVDLYSKNVRISI